MRTVPCGRLRSSIASRSPSSVRSLLRRVYPTALSPASLPPPRPAATAVWASATAAPPLPALGAAPASCGRTLRLRGFATASGSGDAPAGGGSRKRGGRKGRLRGAARSSSDGGAASESSGDAAATAAAAASADSAAADLSGSEILLFAANRQKVLRPLGLVSLAQVGGWLLVLVNGPSLPL